MTKKLISNPNLTVSFEETFNECEVLLSTDGWIVEYLQSIHKTFEKALVEHRRTYALRFELLFPTEGVYKCDDAVITRFFASLKAKLRHNIDSKSARGLRVHPCTLRYVWCKEKNRSLNYHYHVLIFLNRDSYKWLGNVDTGNSRLLSTMIIKAWNSALGFDAEQARALVQQTALGAAEMAASQPEISISQLRANVTSKGGTTHAAVEHLKSHNLHTTVADAMDACISRAQQMEQEL